jgi:hypothetical protein
MKVFFISILILAGFLLGLNATAAGMHSLLPDAPDKVIGFSWQDGELTAQILQYEYHFR